MNRAERRAIAKANAKTPHERKQLALALKLEEQARREAAANAPGEALAAGGFEVVQPKLVLPPGTGRE